MSNDSYIYGMVSVGEAADLLDLSNHQVCALARNGELASSRLGAKTLLVNTESILRYRQLRQGKGRPLDAATAFAALGIISGKTECEMDYPQKRRLKQRLHRITPKELIWQCRKRKRTERFRCSESFLESLSGHLSLSGASALGNAFDLTGDDSRLEGYVSESIVNQLIYDFFLQKDPGGNVVLNIANENPWTEAFMPIGVVAADLAESLNTRERNAGLSKLEELLDGYRNL